MKLINRAKINWWMVLVGIGVFSVQLPFLPDIISFRLYSIVTVGTVTESLYGGKHPLIAFVARDGERITFAGSTTRSVDVGDPIEVRYRLDDPHHAKVNNVFSLYASTLISAFIGFAFIVGGLRGARFSNEEAYDDSRK
jgi:hypothetical protein